MANVLFGASVTVEFLRELLAKQPVIFSVVISEGFPLPVLRVRAGHFHGRAALDIGH